MSTGGIQLQQEGGLHRFAVVLAGLVVSRAGLAQRFLGMVVILAMVTSGKPLELREVAS